MITPNISTSKALISLVKFRKKIILNKKKSVMVPFHDSVKKNVINIVAFIPKQSTNCNKRTNYPC